jgi:catechol 2,3-dioxygenase-like lactoylglutathione lyase family enzyme
MTSSYHINPRIRAYGKARIDVTRRAQNEIEWQKLWRKPLNPFPFEFVPGWKFCVEYKVDDFAAEVGFFIDILGFPVIAFSPSYAQFTTPEGDFCISVSALREADKSTPPETLRLQFRVEDILETMEMLEQRGIIFEQKPIPVQEGSNQVAGYFRTPHGVCVDLWGEIVKKPDIHDLMEDDEEDEDETDRIIQDLLNLPDQDAGERDDVSDEEEETDSEDEYLDEEANEPVIKADIGDKLEGEKPQSTPAPDIHPSNANKPASRPSTHSMYIQGGLSKSSRSTPPVKPAPNSRGNGELTYHEIKNDSDALGEDDL